MLAPVSDVRISPTLVNRPTCLRLIIAACRSNSYFKLTARFGSVRFRPEQISAVTDPVTEQRRPVRVISILYVS